MTARTGLPPIVELEGSPTQMGLAHGRLLAHDVRLLISQIDRHIFRRVGAIRGLGLRPVTRVLALLMDRHVPGRLREEMLGIARGSGVRYADVLLINALDDVLNVLRRLAPSAPSLACSSFAIFGKRSRDGMLLHGRNLDYHFRGTPLDDGGEMGRLLINHTRLFAYRPADRAAFLSVAWPGIVGVTTAMNERGISLGNLTSYVRGTSPNGTPTALTYREICEEAATLRDATAILRSGRRTIGNNLMVGSGGENRASLFEITADTVAEVPPEDGVLVATNHFVSPALAERQRPYLLPHSVARRQRLRDLCSRGNFGMEDAMTFLADVGCPVGDAIPSPFARIANEGTAVSVLFRPAAGEMWLGTNREPPASAGVFQQLNVAALLERA